MMKLKNAKNLDARQSMLVDSAYFQCNPPRVAPRKRKKPLVEWMRYLVVDTLKGNDLKQVRRAIRQILIPCTPHLLIWQFESIGDMRDTEQLEQLCIPTWVFSQDYASRVDEYATRTTCLQPP